jgi:hypothetical protein
MGDRHARHRALHVRQGRKMARNILVRAKITQIGQQIRISLNCPAVILWPRKITTSNETATAAAMPINTKKRTRKATD